MGRCRCLNMIKRLQELLTNAGAWLARPWVVGVVLLYVVLWLIFDSGHFGWHGLATIATLLMTSLSSGQNTATPKPYTRSWTNCCGRMAKREISSPTSMRKSLSKSRHSAAKPIELC